MGTVYRARDASGAQVALKTIHLPQGSFLRSLRREIQALRRLSHPGIVRIVDEGIHEGLPWYAMALLEGETLSQWWTGPEDSLLAQTGQTLLDQTQPELRSDAIALEATRRHTLPPLLKPTQDLSSLMRVLCSLCDTLAFLHGEGLIHRDLKPENIIVMPDGHPVLVDFGLVSRGLGTSSRESLSLEAGISGTVYYMAPEQIQQQLIDARADLYALGVILFELTSGQKPFLGDNVFSIFQGHLLEAPRSDLLDGLPLGLSSLILGLLQKRREARHPSYAEEVGRALAPFASSAPQTLSLPKARPYLYRPSLWGRASALEQLRGALDKLARGVGGLTLLFGESGVGKTRLAMEITREAARLGIQTLTGECQEQRTTPPLSAFLQILQHLADAALEGDEHKRAQLFGSRGKILSAYVPFLAALPGQERYPAPAELPLEATRRRLFAALGECLFAFAAERPLLLVLDDLQWADELSLGFLSFFLQSALLSRHVLLLGTCRADELREELSQLATLPRVSTLSLGLLGEAEVLAMIGEMMALSSPPKLFGRFLTRQSEGNPFFVAEYLRAAVDEGVLFRDAQGAWRLLSAERLFSSEEDYSALPLPGTLRTMLSRRLLGLSAEALHVLQASAVLGREASVSLLLALLEIAEENLERALRELTQRQLLIETRDGRLRLSHGKLQDVTHAPLSAEQRRTLHRRAARLLSQRDAPVDEGVLGHHWEQAGEPERARPLYLSAAKRSAGLYQYQEAERLYRSYFALIEAPNEESLKARLSQVEGVYLLEGKADEALHEIFIARREARALGLRSYEADSLRLVGAAQLMLGKLDEAAASYQEALAASLEDTTPRTEALCRAGLAGVYRIQGRLAESQALNEQALSIFQALDDQRQVGVQLGRLALFSQSSGAISQAKELYEQALSASQRSGDRRMEGIQLGNLAILYQEQGDKETAAGLFRQAVQISRETGDRRMEGVSLGNLANTLLEQASLAEAEALLLQALSISRELRARRFEGANLGNLAELYHLKGQLTQSRVLYEEALAFARESGELYMEVAWLIALAQQRILLNGDLSEVQSLCDEAARTLAPLGDKFSAAKLLFVRGLLLLWEQQSVAPVLSQLSALANELGVSPESELSQNLSALERAHREPNALFRGYRVEDIPAPMRRFLHESGQLEAPSHMLE